MPHYKVTLKQGSRTHTVDQPIEAKSLEDLLTFLEAITTMQVIKVMEIVYYEEYDNRVDDPNTYFNELKLIMGNSEKILQQQFRLPCIKKDAIKNLPELVKKHLSIDGFDIDSINTPTY